MSHFLFNVIFSVVIVFLLTLSLFLESRRPAGRVLEERMEEAAAREFEGAKPALIHAADTAIDKLPEDVDIAAIETKAQAVLTALFTRLLASNPILASGAGLLIGLIPFAFHSLPTTLSVSDYKANLKDEMQKLITEARL